MRETRPQSACGGGGAFVALPPFALYCKLQSAIKCLHHGADANTCARPRRAYCMGPEPNDEGRVLDVAKVEKVEAELSAFIDRRATQRDKANAEADLWAMSERRHRARLREAALRQRLEWHEEQLVRHTKTFEELMRRHRVGLRLCEEALGIAAGPENERA